MGYVEEYSKKIADLQTSGITSRIADIDAHINQQFSANLSEAANLFRTSLPANTHLTVSSALVRETLTRASEDVNAYIQWLHLKTPVFEDGGNYGVIVQAEVLKGLQSFVEKINTALDAIPDYFEKRGAAVEKISSKSSTETKQTNSQSSSTGGKDGNEEKSSTSKTEEKAERSSTPLHDQIENVVAIDLKYYIAFKRNLEMVKSSYIIIQDIVTKNFERLDAPRGKKSSHSHLSMF